MLRSFASFVVLWDPFSLRICLSIFSYSSFHEFIRCNISSWLASWDGNFVFFISRLNLLWQRVRFILVLSPPTLRGTVCSISYLGLSPKKSIRLISSPVYRHLWNCSSQSWYFKISVSDGSRPIFCSLYSSAIFLRHSSRYFSLLRWLAWIALRRFVLLSSRENSICMIVSSSIFLSLSKRLITLRRRNNECMAMGLRTLFMRGLPNWYNPTLLSCWRGYASIMEGWYNFFNFSSSTW